MKVLVINSGSSSLKFELVDMTKEETLAKGICERIGINDSKLVYKNIVKDTKNEISEDMPNHKVAIDLVLKALQDSEKQLCQEYKPHYEFIMRHFFKNMEPPCLPKHK